MATIPSDALPPSLMNIVVDARNSNAAHAYYSNGWEIEHTNWNNKAILPGYMYDKCTYTVVFKHTGNPTTTTYQLILGWWQHEDQTRVAIQSKGRHYNSLVTKNSGHVSNIYNDISNIKLEGFHVLEYKNEAGALEVFLDGTRCLHPKSLTQGPEQYTVFKSDPIKGSPFSIWEGHFIFADYKALGAYRFSHDNMELGVGSYYQFHLDWSEVPKLYVGKNTEIGWLRVSGEQVITIRVYKDNCFITSSADQPNDDAILAYNCWPPLSSAIYCSWKVNACYNITVVFAEIVTR